MASVVLGFRRADVAHPLDGFGMLIPEKEGFDILGALFSSSLFPHRAPEGEVLITCYIGGARAPLLPLELARGVGGNRRQRPGSDFGRPGPPDFSACRRLSPRHSAIQPGIRKSPRAYNDMESKAPGLFVAGHARDGISLGDSIVSGHNVAARIQAYLESNSARLNPANHPLSV